MWTLYLSQGFNSLPNISLVYYKFSNDFDFHSSTTFLHPRLLNTARGKSSKDTSTLYDFEPQHNILCSCLRVSRTFLLSRIHSFMYTVREAEQHFDFLTHRSTQKHPLHPQLPSLKLHYPSNSKHLLPLFTNHSSSKSKR